MISMKKRGLCLILLLCTMLAAVGGYCKTAKAAITFNNTANYVCSSSVNASGKLRTDLNVSGFKNITTQIQADLYVEKRILGIFWQRVNIGYTNNVWHDSTTSYHYNNFFTFQLPTTGTYRVTVTFTVSGSGGPDDIITATNTVTY